MRPKDLSTPELRRVVAGWRADPGLPRPTAHEVQLERRLALPAAPLLFGLMAMPLALQRRRGARSWSVLCSVALVLGYYAVLASGQQLALAGLVSPRLGLWSPNLVLACTGSLLVLRDRRSQG
jgi:lipopolysaccharide export system permease protein